MRGRRGGSKADLPAVPEVNSGQIGVPCIAARDEADDIAAYMLARLLGRRGILATHRSLPSL